MCCTLREGPDVLFYITSSRGVREVRAQSFSLHVQLELTTAVVKYDLEITVCLDSATYGIWDDEIQL